MKNKPQKNSPAAPEASGLKPSILGLLLAFAVGESLLAIYQWLELLSVRRGNTAACEIGETLNCATVWNSGFASSMHALTGLPVAALGLVWGLVATALVVLLIVWTRSKKSIAPALNALRVVAIAGIVASIVFFLASLSSGAACLTCIGTYVLTLGFAGTVLFALPGARLPGQGEWVPALAWAGGLTLLFWGLLLPLGLATPRTVATTTKLPTMPVAGATPDAGSAPAGPLSDREQLVKSFLGTLSPDERQAIANNLALYRNAERKPVNYPARKLKGRSDAPVKIIDWTDIKCGHCAHFEEAMQQIEQAVPAELISVEPRQFPLAGECLVKMKRPDPSGVRCLAAKSLICLEDSPQFWQVRSKMFAEQEALDADRVIELATSTGLSRPALDACVTSAATQEKLEQDMAYAEAYGLEGTPFVLLNGRSARPFPTSFLYALILTGGNPDSGAFAGLPPPSISGRDPHEGHAH